MNMIVDCKSKSPSQGDTMFREVKAYLATIAMKSLNFSSKIIFRTMMNLFPVST